MDRWGLQLRFNRLLTRLPRVATRTRTPARAISHGSRIVGRRRGRNPEDETGRCTRGSESASTERAQVPLTANVRR